MLQNRTSPTPQGIGDWLPANATPELGEMFDGLLVQARRQWTMVAAGVAGGLALGLLYVTTAVPLYTAGVDILLQESASRLLSDFADRERPTDDAVILSQVELLQSDKIAGRVVDALGLDQDPRFAASLSPLRQARDMAADLFDVTGWLGARLPEEEATARRNEAIARLLEDVEVFRVDRSYVISVYYTSPWPDLAGMVAAAYGDAYLADRLEAKYAATRSASDWLLQRIEELRGRSLDSDLAVQRFRAENGLISAAGVLVTDRNLSQLNTSLVDARAETSRAKARLDRIREIIASGSPDELVTDALNSPLINNLRASYLERAKLRREIAERLGTEHSSVARIDAEMEEYRRQIFGELGRIAQSYESEYNVAVANERAIRDEVDRATGVTAAGNEVMVQLRELEREAETYRTLYETFLQRYQEAVQQESFPATGARIINEARTPTGPSHPRKILVLAFAVALGGLAGVGVGAFREFRERFVRTSDDVRNDLGLEFLGIAPLVTGSQIPVPEDPEQAGHPKFLQKTNTISSIVLDHPHSQFAETLRSARLAADMALGRGRQKTIGIISVLPGEGKSTISVNLGELLSEHGGRTLLIDADLRRPGVTWAVARHARAGIVEAIVDRKPLSELVLKSRETCLEVLPAVIRKQIAHTSRMLSSPGMAALLEEARASYDTVLVDLPPIAPVVDARAITPEIDAYILVVEWGRTARQAVRSVLEAEPQIMERCLGVILNKVDRDRMKLYWGYGSSDYYQSTYSDYGKPDA